MEQEEEGGGEECLVRCASNGYAGGGIPFDDDDDDDSCSWAERDANRGERDSRIAESWSSRNKVASSSTYYYI